MNNRWIRVNFTFSRVPAQSYQCPQNPNLNPTGEVKSADMTEPIFNCTALGLSDTSPFLALPLILRGSTGCSFFLNLLHLFQLLSLLFRAFDLHLRLAEVVAHQGMELN